MMVGGCDQRIWSVAYAQGMVGTRHSVNQLPQTANGIVPDGKSMLFKAREQAKEYEKYYGIKMPGKNLADRIGMDMHIKTCYMQNRPYGTSLIIASHDKIRGLGLYMVEPSGASNEYYGCASGRGKQLARNEIEKGNFRELTCEQALPKLAVILLKAQEEMKEKTMELELSVLTETPEGWRHRVLDRPTVDKLTEDAEKAIEDEDMDMS